MKRLSWAIGLSLAAAATVSHAQHGVTLSVGTPGVGVHVSRALQPNLNARLGVNFLEYSHDVSTRDVDYDIDLRMRSVDALLDWFPATSGFRVTGGLVYNANRFGVTGRPGAGSTYTLAGRVYPAATVGTVQGEVDFRRLNPYLGIGWGNAASGQKGWGFSADLGVQFQGRPRSNLTNQGCTGPALVCAQIAADVAAENQNLRDELKDFRYLPVLRVGAIYRF